MINYFFLHFNSFVSQVFQPAICSICLFASLGVEKQTFSRLPISFNLFIADFLSLAKNFPIKYNTNHNLNTFLFTKSCATNRKFWNFLEYQFKGNYNRCCNFPNSLTRTFLNSNIPRQSPNFKFHSQSMEQQSK